MGQLNALNMVEDYHADPTGRADAAPIINKAITDAAAAKGGVVYFPPGVYRTTASVILQAGTTLLGAGKRASTIAVDHGGDGVQSTHKINASSAADVSVSNLGIVTTKSGQAGGGFVDVGGTYITVEDCLISGFKFQVILDQSELVVISRNQLVHPGSTHGIWLVNGPDHTRGAASGFTNRITIRDNQFNGVSRGAGTSIIDDGGSALVIENNNFNGGRCAIRSATSNALTVRGNEMEPDGIAIMLERSALQSGAFNGPCLNPTITGNYIQVGNGATHAVELWGAIGGSIEGNTFSGFTSAAIMIHTYLVARMNIGANTVAHSGGPMIADAAGGDLIAGQNYYQRLNTHAADPVSPGGQNVTPADMGYPNTTAHIVRGSYLYCCDADGSNAERVQVTAATPQIFSAFFKYPKSAGFHIYLVS